MAGSPRRRADATPSWFTWGEPSVLLAVAVGAGHLPALGALLRSLPPDAGMAIILMGQGLSEDALHELPPIPAVEVGRSAALTRNSLFVPRADHPLLVTATVVRAVEPDPQRAPEDVLFASMATWGERGIAVCLGGAAGPGAAVLAAAGGHALRFGRDGGGADVPGEQVDSIAELLERLERRLESRGIIWGIQADEEASRPDRQARPGLERVLRWRLREVEAMTLAGAGPAVLLDAEGRIWRFTPGMRQVAHLLAADVGRPAGDMAGVLSNPELLELARRAAEGEERTRVLPCGDGRWVRVRASPFRAGSREPEGALLAFEDVTDETRARERLQSELRRSERLADLVLSALSHEEIERLVDSAMSALVEVLEADWVDLLVAVPSGELVLEATRGRPANGPGRRSVSSDSFARQVFEEGRPSLIGDYGREQVDAPVGFLRERGVRSSARAPVPGPGAPVGVLGAHAARTAAFDEDALAAVNSVARLIGEALQRQGREQELRRVAAQLEERVRERTMIVALLQDVAVIANRSDAWGGACEAVLVLVCRALRWPLAHVWLPEGEPVELVDAGVWTASAPGRYEEAFQRLRAQRLQPGQGVSGRAFVERTVTCGPSDPELAANELASVCGVPVLAGEEVVAVLEFLHIAGRVEPRTVDALSQIGTELGRVAERDRAAGALRASEDQYRAIVEDQTELVMRFGPDGRLVFVNQACCRFFAQTQQELLERSAWDLLPEDEREPWRDHLRGLSPGSCVRAYAHRCRLADGSLGWIERTDRALFDPEISLVGFQSVCRDVTQRRRVEEERQRLEAQTRRVELLEGLEAISGGIAHDFNNMLVGILGNLSLVEEVASPEPPLQEHLQEIRQAAERAAELCRQLQSYSGRAQLDMRPLALNELIQRLWGEVESRAAGRGVEVRLELRPDLPAVQGDPDQLRAAVLNLVTNAVESTPSSDERPGLVVVQTGLQVLDEPLAAPPGASVTKAGSFAYVEVADTGPGVPASALPRVFDPFATDDPHTGRGLGLAAVLGIAQAHRGAVTVESQPGRGTRFRMLLPTSAGVPRPLAQRRDFEAEPWPFEGTLLVIDDDRGVRRYARGVLERLGFEVLSCASGEEALEVFRERHGRLSAVLLDLTMPGLSGRALLQALYDVDSAVPVLLTSGFEREKALERLEGVPIAGFLQKPYRVDEVARALRAALTPRR